MKSQNNRLLSLDFFRGLTMFLLVAEYTHLYRYLRDPSLKGTWIHSLGIQLSHLKWDGMTFWDNIHPFFVFIVGVAMPFAFANRMKKGETQQSIFKHVLKRSGLLLLLGWMIVCVDNGKVVFSFLDVLCSIAFWYLIGYLVMNKSVTFQIVFSLSLILITELLYRFFPVEGYNEAFTIGKNFGTWIDVQTNQVNEGNWSFFNKIPGTAHIIWGILAGKLLMSDKPAMKKVKILALCGAIGLVLGYGLSGFTPIIKRISTSTWVLASGGLALVVFALCYWLIDVKGRTKGIKFFNVVGMNSIFIYVFVSIGGAKFVKSWVQPFSNALFQWLGEWGLKVATALIALAILWYICYWLYKKKIFFRV